ncbi:MAG: hypothetical protein QXN55_01725 [Candidatus Nitrosotenuis sp.]
MKVSQLTEARTPSYSIPENAVKTPMTLLECKLELIEKGFEEYAKL